MKKLLFALIFSLALVSIFSCEKDDGLSGTDPNEMIDETGIEVVDLLEGEKVINIRLTDNPTDLVEVNIDVIGMYIVADSSRFNLSTVQGVYNLLDFQNGIDTLISQDTFDITFLKDIVLELGDNNNVVDSSGAVFPLELPSNNRDFLVIKFNTQLDTMDLLDIQIDFDACKSIRETGNGRYILKPVLNVRQVNGRDNVGGGNGESVDSPKVAEIKASYPDFDQFNIERASYCFYDPVMILVEMKSTRTDRMQTVLLNQNCELLYTVENEELENIDIDLEVVAEDVVNGNAEVFKRVLVLTSPSNEVLYGLKLIRGRGNSGVEISAFINERAVLVCID